MAILKCKMCGGDIVVNEEKTFGTCEYCGSVMTLPKVSDEQRAARFNRGNHFRRQGDFDKALAVYESIVREDDTDAEAHWCCALCRFGIEYVEDPNTYEFLPTCHRASFDSFTEDVDYLAALENSDGITKRQYQKDAAKIAEVQRGILATSQNEEPYDVFICYKETDDQTKERTRDSLDAQEIYYQLTQEGYRVFFSRITLEDKAGAEYEPYIFAALNSAKVMVAIGSKPEYFNAVWVKNEWSRFLAMMRKDRSKLLLPCYKGMDPYDLPEQLGILQSYDMAKIGFMQDLIRGIKKVLRKEEPKAQPQATVVSEGIADIQPLLKRMFMYLEDGEWDKAIEYSERVLDKDPENAEAYVGKLMSDLKVRRRTDLNNQTQPFNENKNFKKAIRFANAKQKNELNGFIDFINNRNAEQKRKEEEERHKQAEERRRQEKEHKEKLYNEAVRKMNDAVTKDDFLFAAQKLSNLRGYKDADVLCDKCQREAEQLRKEAEYKAAVEKMKNASTTDDYQDAAACFCSIAGFKDANSLADKCLKKAEAIRNDAIYENATAEMKKNCLDGYLSARDRFRTIPGWKDADKQLASCEKQIKEITDKKAEEDRITTKKKKKRIITISSIVAAVVVITAAIVIVFNTVIVPNNKYNSAMTLFDEGKYDEAIAAFGELNGFKDSNDKMKECESKAGYDIFTYETLDDGTAEITGVTDSANEINIPSMLGGHDVTSIGSKAFENNTNLTSVNISGSVKKIGAYAFSKCTKLADITISDSVSVIEKYAFDNCTALTTVKISDSVTTIDNNAFYNCINLSSVTIGKSVTSIGESLFNQCKGLKSIEVDCNNTAYCSVDGNLYDKSENQLIQYAIGNSANSFTIPDSVTQIHNNAFSGCSLTTVTIPNSVKTIGDSAFTECQKLTSVSIPDSVTNLGAMAFSGCAKIQTATIGNSVTEIKERTFYECEALTSATIGNSVTSIGDQAFYFCSLTAVTIPNSVTSIGMRAFDSCSLTSLSLGNSVNVIGNNAFYGCNLKSVTIPKSVTTIEDQAFFSCDLTSVVIPDSVTTIGKAVFDLQQNDQKVIIYGSKGSAAEKYANSEGLTFRTN